MPDFPIVDAHLHLYDPEAIRFDWMRDEPTLNRPHLPATFRAALGGVELAAAVFVEVDAAPGRHMDEVRFVSDLDAPFLRGMVASMPLEAGPDAVARDLADYAARPLARGVRRLIERHSDEPGWAVRAPFVEAVRTLPGNGLTFDLCVRHGQMREATELVRRCPDVTFVLDHIGKPAIREGRLDPWRDDIAAMAALPNVWCKISGVVTEADHAAWTEQEVVPYIHHALECFGWDRVMFGGDWPVSTLATTYERWVAVVDRASAGAAGSQRRRLWRDNAVAFYRLDMG